MSGDSIDRRLGRLNPDYVAKPVKAKFVVTLVHADDWTGLYVGGKRVMQNHSLRLGSVLEVVSGLGEFTLEEITADEEWLDRECELPKLLVSVKRAT